jgi:RND family efflux transporter MFP subunit
MNRYTPQQLTRGCMAIAFFAFIFFVLIKNTTQNANAVDQKNVQAIAVTGVTAHQGSVQRRMTFSGPVVGRDEVPVYSELAQGRIDKILVEAGQHVKAGTVLATIDASALRIQKAQQQATQQKASVAIKQQENALEEAQVQYSQAQAERQRAEVVAETGLISREVRDQRITAEQSAKARVQAMKNSLSMAQADLNLASAQLAESDLRLNQAEIRSPVSGTVIDRKARTGMSLAQNSEPLFNVLRDDDIEVELEVSADDASRLKLGMPVSIELIANASSTKVSNNDTAQSASNYKGKISRAATQINRQNQIAKVRVRFDQTPNLILGQFARVAVNATSRSGIYLPDTAVRFEGSSAYVFIAKEGLAKRQTVKVGQHIGNKLEIFDGVSAGMVVIDTAASFLRDGEPVKVTTRSSN